jgi:hypothetical protein
MSDEDRQDDGRCAPTATPGNSYDILETLETASC